MSDYIQLSLASIDLVQKLVVHEDGSQLPINSMQCRYLAGKLSITRQFLEDSLGSLHMHEKLPIAHLHIYSVLKRAESLVLSCSCKNSTLLEAAVSFPEIKEDIVDIILELWCWTSMLTILMKGQSPSHESVALELLKSAEEDFQRLYWGIRKDNSHLQFAAAYDKHTLMKKLEEVKEACVGRSNSVEHDRDCILAVYLQSRCGPAEGVDFADAIQRTLNHCDVTRAIGHGTFGQVLEVKWLGRRCALKIRNQDTKEARSLSQCQHPHIVQFLRSWEAPYNPDSEPGHRLQSHILMELMECDLSDKIAAENYKHQPSSSTGEIPTMPFPLEVAIDTMLQMAKAMCYLHDSKMTHRDLKPKNVLLSRAPEAGPETLHQQGYLHVKIADFDMCKTYDESWALSMTPKRGTTAYSAPEIFCPEEFRLYFKEYYKNSKDKFTERNYPKEADVWSFGMTCSEILTGQVPFIAEKRSDLQVKIMKGNIRPTLPNECPECLRFCITSCWELDPKDRPGFLEILRMLRYAKMINLGLLQLEDCMSLFSYKTRNGDEKRMRPLASNDIPRSSDRRTLIRRIGVLFGVATRFVEPLKDSTLDIYSASDVQGDDLYISSAWREENVHFAKVAQQVARYEDMVEAIEKVARSLGAEELTKEERDLLAEGHKSVIMAKRSSWRIISSIKQKEESKGNEDGVATITEFQAKVEIELNTICTSYLKLLDKHLIPTSMSGESKAFYLKLKGDYHRYLAEVKSGAGRKEAATAALLAYDSAQILASTVLSPTHPIRLAVGINFSCLYYEILKHPERACTLAQQVYDEALSEINDLGAEDVGGDTVVYLECIYDNLSVWKKNMQQRDDQKYNDYSRPCSIDNVKMLETTGPSAEHMGTGSLE